VHTCSWTCLLKIRRNVLITLIFGGALIAICLVACSQKLNDAKSGANSPDTVPPLRMATSPYQNLALLVTEKLLALEKKYHCPLELITMPWEDIIPALGSAGQTVDVGYVSLTDYLTKLPI